MTQCHYHDHGTCYTTARRSRPGKLPEIDKIGRRLLLINGGGPDFCFHTLIRHLDLAEI
jgi:hypothetical protein